ncbi:extracellular solute-binding protein [Streptomyces phyllanthi]|nr:extracellular solute-binding protein [Streptomyces phyllanthi]
MRHRARTITAAMAALALTAGLAGCGGVAESESRTTTLTVIATNYGDSRHKNSQGYWDRVALAFRTEHPGIDVDISVHSADTVEKKVAELVERGEAPDIVQTDSYAEYADQGLLHSADELLSIPVQASFVPSLTEAGEMKRVQYGMPFTVSTRLLYYNKDLFRQAGLKPPNTWKELLAAARALKARGVKYPIAVPLGPQEAEAETLMWLLSGGGGYTDSTDHYDLASPENVSTLKWLKSTLVAEGLTGPVAPGELNRNAALLAFIEGEAAMVNAPLSLMRQIDDSTLSVPYGTVPLPSRTGKEEPTMGTADWVIAFKQREHREEIGRFLDFLYGEKYVTEQAALYQLLPVTVPAADAMRADRKQKSLWNGLDTLQNLELYPVSETNWSQVAEAVRSRIGKAVAPGGDPEAVLSSLADVAD